MTGWSDEVLRAAVETHYWRNYRHRGRPRGTILEFQADLIPEEELLEKPRKSPDDNRGTVNDASEEDKDRNDGLGSDWLRRFFGGHHERATGRYVFTTPKSKRLAQLRALVNEKRLLTPVALVDHTEPHAMAEAMAAAMGFDRFADQILLRGTFRGMLTATALTPTLISEAVLLTHFLKDESYFRVREIQVHYDRRQGEELSAAVQRAGNLDFDRWRVRDGFASFGTNYGEIFLLRAHDGGFGGYAISNLEFIDRGRRVAAFAAKSGDDPDTVHQFRLCCRPSLIDRAVQLLWRVSNKMAPANAAE